jgi:hypothetical protein
MNDQGRRIVVDRGFEAIVAETGRAIREEGLQVIASIDHFWRDSNHDSDRYALLEACSLELRLELLQQGATPAVLLLTTFAIYELAECETAVVVTEPFSSDPDWRREVPVLAAIADRERDRIARVLERLQHPSRPRTITSPAA